MRRASRPTSAQFVRVIEPSPQAVTISRVGCSRTAWSMSRVTRSGKSCIAPSFITRLSTAELPGERTA
jgi:hypothetical protein